MVDVKNYEFNIIMDKTVANECLGSKSTIITTRRMHRIVDAKYKNADLNKVMTKQCQHLTPKNVKYF